MNDSLKQYLDLYKEHKDLIDRKSSPLFNKLRGEACQSLEKFGLPRKGTENYEITDLPAILAPDFGLNLARIPLDVNPYECFKCGVPHLSSSLFFFLNDIPAESREARKTLPEGVEIGPLSSFFEMAEDYYGKLADITNPIVALNSMLGQEGLFIRIKKDAKMQRPLQLISLLENTMPLMAMRRLLIIVEENAELKLLNCSHTTSSNIPMASVGVIEMFVGRGARVEFYDMEESGEKTSRLTATYLRQEEGSDVILDTFTLHNGQTRNEFHCAFKGRNSRLRLYGLGIEGKESKLDNYSNIRHEVPDCTTEELFKYIVEQEAQGAFTGRIFVAPGASKTEAYQSNRNLVTSSTARMFSKPQLEIYNDDVKCSHGSATGQLDEMQLFYLRSRGIDEEEARFLLKQAFAADVIEGISMPLLKERLYKLIERRFGGEDTTCGECEICNPSKR